MHLFFHQQSLSHQIQILLKHKIQPIIAEHNTKIQQSQTTTDFVVIDDNTEIMQK
jgi:hypothetical protein